MYSSLIGKVQKAQQYAQERERVHFSQFNASFRGEHDSYQVTYHDGNWWCILCDGITGSYFYRLVDDHWEKGTSPDALVYPGAYTRADVLSKGDILFVLEWEASSPRLYKYAQEKPTCFSPHFDPYRRWH